MSANLFQPSLTRAITKTGDVAGGAKMYFYNAQTSTLAPQYVDPAGTTPGTNPRVADATGKFEPVYIDPNGIYRVVLTSSSGADVFFDVDSVRGYDLGMISEFAESASAAAVSAASSAATALVAASTATNASSTAASVSVASSAYPNAYASTLPKGVTSTTITAPGTGYTNGTYALGVSGGPTGFEGTYTVSGNVVTSVSITNPGLATGTTAPTLSFPSGGGTGATATATVSSIIPDQKTYWVASADSLTINLYRNNAGAVATVTNPDGSVVTLPQSKFLDAFFETHSYFITAPAADSSLSRLTVALFDTVNGAPLTLPSRLTVRRFGRDSVSRFECDFAGFDGTSTYPPAFYAENGGGGYGNYQFVTGQTGPKTYDALCADASIGVPVGTVIGKIYVSDISGPFGPGFNVDIPWSVGGIYPDKLQSTTVELQRIGEKAKKTFDKQYDVFKTTVADAYLLSLLTKISIERGVPGRTYVMKIFSGFDGSNYKLSLDLVDPVLGVTIANWTKSNPTTFSPPGVVHLSGAANGSPSGGGVNPTYIGTSATVWLDPSQINWTYGNNNSTANTTTAGIRPENVLTREQVRDLLRNGPVQKTLTVGAVGCDYTTIRAAIEACMDDPGCARSAFPFSTGFATYCATPSNQIEIVVMDDAYTETTTEVVVGGVGRGMILWAGLTIRLRADTVIQTTGSTTYGGPIFEGSFGGRIIAPRTALLKQLGYGYVIHIDSSNRLSIPAAAGPALQYYQLVFLCDGCTLYAASGQNAWIVGRGIDDEEDVEFRNGAMLRQAGSPDTPAYYGLHTSPNRRAPGRSTFRNMVFNDGSFTTGTVALSVGISETNTAFRDELVVENSKLAKIATQGTSFIGLGALPAGATVLGGSLD